MGQKWTLEIKSWFMAMLSSVKKRVMREMGKMPIEKRTCLSVNLISDDKWSQINVGICDIVAIIKRNLKKGEIF